MSKAKDLTGQRFGRLIALEKVGKHWECQCDCGKVVLVQACHLLSNHTRSCGCFQKEASTLRATKHGKSGERILGIWYGMKKRCFCKTCKAYHDYGGRGITICQEWLNDFQNFYDWATANGYAENLTIDRIDVNGNYEPSNCRWIPLGEQANNKRTSHLLTYNGETHTMKDWAKIIGIKYSTLRGRINSYGWTVEKALTTKTKK